MGTAMAVFSVARAQVVPRTAPPVNPASPLPGILPNAVPNVAPPTGRPDLAAPAAVGNTQVYAITNVSIEGVTAYPPGTFGPLTAGLTGPAVSLAKIEIARTAIVNRYRADDFIYTAVSAHISGTQLRLVVIESRIVSIKLRDNVGPVGAQILRFLNHLTDVQPITNAALERWLLLANDIPGIEVKSFLSPSTTDPGALTLEAQVTRKPFSAELRADNRAFRQTGPEELLALVDANSFTSLGERTEISLYHTFNDTDTFGQALEEFFIGGSGLKLQIYGGAGESTPSGSLRQLGYDGVTRVFGAKLSYPWIRSRRQSLTVSALFDGLESDIDYDITGKPVRQSFDSLRILRADAQYVFSDLWFGPRFGAANIADLEVSQGLPILGASSNGAPQLPRINERVDFTKVDAKAQRTQVLYAFNPDQAFKLLGAVAGQYSDNILPPEEKFYLGGPDFNRGFYYGEVTGDSALEAKVEPQFDTPLPMPAFVPVPVKAEFYGFYDWGEVWQEQKLDLDHTLRSIGGGVRLSLGAFTVIDLEGLSRLTRTPDGEGPGITPLKSSAFYWQLLIQY